MYDLVIIGGGPAGLSAAVYAARYKMNIVVLAQLSGGFTNNAHLVENWLGEKSIEGPKLAHKFVEHAKNFNVEIANVDVQAIEKVTEIVTADETTKTGEMQNSFKVLTTKGEFQGKRILLATGTERSKLGVKGEQEFYGRGVSYCATCDGFFFRDRTVAVVGGGDSAATAAIFLADLAEKVYLIHRRDELRADPSWQEKLKNNKKIQLVLGANVAEIAGENKVEKVILDTKREIEVDGVFIEVGATPASTFIKGLGVKLDEKGFIVVDDKQKTSVRGVFAAGDITTKSDLKQMIVAASEGAIAAYNAFLEAKAEK